MPFNKAYYLYFNIAACEFIKGWVHSMVQFFILTNISNYCYIPYVVNTILKLPVLVVYETCNQNITIKQ